MTMDSRKSQTFCQSFKKLALTVATILSTFQTMGKSSIETELLEAVDSLEWDICALAKETSTQISSLQSRAQFQYLVETGGAINIFTALQGTLIIIMVISINRLERIFKTNLIVVIQVRLWAFIK